MTTRAFRASVPDGGTSMPISSLSTCQLVLPPSLHKACSEMAAEGRGSRDRALARLEAAAVIVQARVARGCVGRAIARRARERREVARQHAMLNWAASLLQTRWGKGSGNTGRQLHTERRLVGCLHGVRSV